VSLAWKIALSAGIPVVFFVGATGAGLRCLAAADTGARRTLRRIVVVAGEARAAGENAAAAGRLHGRWSAFPDATYERLWATRMGALDQRLQTVSRLLEQDVERRRLTKATRMLGRYRALASTEDVGRVRLRALSPRELHAATTLSAGARRTLASIARRLETSARAVRDEEVVLARSLHEMLRAAAALAVVLAVILSGWAALRVARALRRLAWASEALERGRLDEPVAIGGRDELARLGSAFEALAVQLLERDRAGDQLLRGLGEELDQPLQAIRDTTHGLADDLAAAGTPQQRRLVATFGDEAGELLRRAARIGEAQPRAADLEYVTPAELGFDAPRLLVDRRPSEGLP
jgi:HAMP domain-containing protein